MTHQTPDQPDVFEGRAIIVRYVHIHTYIRTDYTYVCMYICASVCTYVCMYVCPFVAF